MEATQERRLLAGWAVAMLVFWLTTCVESLSWNQLSAFTPLYLREMGVQAAGVPGWTAAMASLSWVIGIPLAPFWGVLADRYSRKAIIVRSALVEAIIFTGWALSTGPWMALVFRCLSGFVLGNTGVMLAVQASITPRQRLGLAVGVVGAGSPAGRAIGPILGAGLIHLFDVRGMLLFDAAASLAIAVLLAVLVVEPERVRRVESRVLAQLKEAVGEIVGHPLIWRLFVAVTFAMIGYWVVGPLLPLHIARIGGYSTQAAAATAIGSVLSAMAVSQAVSSPLWGRLVDKFGHVPVLAFTSVGAALAMLTAGLVGSLWAFAVALVAYGACAPAVSTAMMALLASTVSPERRGAVLGQVFFPFYVGGLVGPPIGALLLGGGPIVLFGAAALFSLLPLVMLQGYRRAMA